MTRDEILDKYIAFVPCEACSIIDVFSNFTEEEKELNSILIKKGSEYVSLRESIRYAKGDTINNYCLLSVDDSDLPTIHDFLKESGVSESRYIF